MFREIIAVYSHSLTNHVSTFPGQNAGFYNAVSDDTYSYQGKVIAFRPFQILTFTVMV
jgi:hypothetical protein